MNLSLSKPVYCRMCLDRVAEKKRVAERIEQQDAEEYEKLFGIDRKHEDRFYNAARAVSAVGDYRSAISKAASHSQDYGSVPEAVAAIILASCGVRFMPQARIFKDRRMAVDFMLPDHKICIEIDGGLYHANKEKSALRDYSISLRLGSDWEVLHIPAETMMKNIEQFARQITMRLTQKTA